MDADLYKIKPEDFAGKGVSAQSNPMELPEDEAKAVFDQLAKDVLTPKFNALVDALADLDITADADKPISDATQTALDKKVDKEKKTGSETEEKVLSDNNYSDAEKAKVTANTEARHGHENKAILDGIGQDDINRWDDGLSDNNYTDTEKAKVAANTEARHGHDNKAVLDGIKQTDIANWNGGNVLTKDNTEEYHPTLPFHPATVDYVDKKVVAIGAADMTKAVYDPNGRETDIFAAIDDAKYMTDDVTGKVYFLGISNGGLYYKEKEDAANE